MNGILNISLTKAAISLPVSHCLNAVLMSRYSSHSVDNVFMRISLYKLISLTKRSKLDWPVLLNCII